MKVLEHYTSVQGEGPRTGTLTQFVRFAGCNMRCPGWPCDTQHAIQPELYRGKYEEMSPAALAMAIMTQYEREAAKNVCFTGGEPFMQKQDELLEVIASLSTYSYEFFTNGSFLIPNLPDRAIVMMDWKLAGSGEAKNHRETRFENAYNLRSCDGIKFVVKDYRDLAEAVDVYTELKTVGCNAQFWVGSAWSEIHESFLVEWLKGSRMPWKLNVQVHKYIWPADKIGV